MHLSVFTPLAGLYGYRSGDDFLGRKIYTESSSFFRFACYREPQAVVLSDMPDNCKTNAAGRLIVFGRFFCSEISVKNMRQLICLNADALVGDLDKSALQRFAAFAAYPHGAADIRIRYGVGQ